GSRRHTLSTAPLSPIAGCSRSSRTSAARCRTRSWSWARRLWSESNCGTRTAVSARAGAAGVAILLLALSAAGAASPAPAVTHFAQLRSLYAKDHAGAPPPSEAALVTYSKQFEKVLASCTISSSDLADAAIFWSGQISSLGGARTSSLSILREFGRHI